MQIRSNTPLKNPPEDYCPPGSDNWFTLTEGYDEGKSLFYYDTGSNGNAAPDATVLFVHGNPECSYTFRHVRDSLSASGRNIRMIGVDHVGFGLSDQADFEMVDMHHAVNLTQLVRALDLHDISLVVHDWGGPIGVGALLQDPARVSSLLVANTTVFPMPADGLTYQNFPFPWLPWCHTPNLVPDSLWGGVAAAVVSHAHPQSAGAFVGTVAKWLTKHAMRSIPEGRPEYVWSQMLRSRCNARSSKRNVRQTPFWGHGYTYVDQKHGLQDNHDFYAHIQENVKSAWGPQGRDVAVTGFFGQWDACGKDSVIQQWHEALPHMKQYTHLYPELGHFIEEYKGPEMAEAILQMNGLTRSSA